MSEIRKIREPKLYAQEKLEEARYFLLQMRAKYVDRMEFIHNMNAFLNSARNVTFVLQREFNAIPSLKDWYEKKREQMKRDTLMIFFKERRNVSVKEATPKHSLSIKWAYIIPKDERTDVLGYSERKVAGDDKNTDVRLVMPTFDKTGMHSEAKIIEPEYSLVTLWEFDESPEGYECKDILGLCTKYYHKLERLIAEARRELTKTVWKRRNKPCAHSLKCRKRLNAARFFYGQMKSEFQDRIIFHYLLDAFVASARSVTHVFQAEFNDNEYLMRWYQKRRKEWRQNEIMKFFKKLRNVSLKEHTPDTQTRSSIKWGINVIFSDKDVKKVVDSNGKEHWVTPLLPLEVIDKEIVGYAFLHDFKWFDKSPDVMALCKEYLEELDRFVSEVENMVGREEREQV